MALRCLIFTMMLNGAAVAQSIKCETLYDYGQHGVALCVSTLGGVTTYSRQTLTDSSASIETIDYETYKRLMDEDIVEMKAAAERQKAINDMQEKFLKDVDERAAKAKRGEFMTDVASSPEESAFQVRVAEAAGIHDKKHCKAAGFRWLGGNKHVESLCFPRK